MTRKSYEGSLYIFYLCFFPFLFLCFLYTCDHWCPGFVIGKMKSLGKRKVSDQLEENSNWDMNAKFQSITYWNHDSLPSQDDAFLRSFHFLTIAKAVSFCLRCAFGKKMNYTLILRSILIIYLIKRHTKSNFLGLEILQQCYCCFLESLICKWALNYKEPTKWKLGLFTNLNNTSVKPKTGSWIVCKYYSTLTWN